MEMLVEACIQKSVAGGGGGADAALESSIPY
jgi:hypothetical protein